MKKKVIFLTMLLLGLSGVVAGANDTELIYEMPNYGNDTTVPEHLLGYPNQASGGLFGPQIIGMTFGGIFLTFLAGGFGARISILTSGFGTWVVSLLLYGVTMITNLKLITEYHVIVTSTILLVGLIVSWTAR